MTTRIGLGTILGQLQLLPIEIIARIKDLINLELLTKRLKQARVTANLWINHELTGSVSEGDHEYQNARLFASFGWSSFLEHMREGVEGILDVRRQEDRIRRLRE